MSPCETPRPAAPVRVGYVTKMYPRFSETFIVNEIRGIEAEGCQVDIFSLRAPVDTRFHASLAQVRAAVHYVARAQRATDAWSALRQAHETLALDRLSAGTIGELLAADPEDAIQALDVAAMARRLGIEHLHAHFGSVAASVARLAARLLGIGYSFTAHAKDIYHRDVDEGDLQRKLADSVFAVTVSEFNLRYLRETFGPAAAGVERVYNGLDLNEFGYVAAGRDPRRICAVGRLVEKKGFGHLLRAMRMLHDDGTHLTLDLVGAGPLDEDLREQASQLGLGDSVHFTGPLPQDEVRELVAKASLFVAPCVVGLDGNRDGLPTVILEAMALGTPVVATPVTGIPEVVERGKTGYLVPAGDAVALATVIREALENPDEAHGLARAARHLIEESFDSRITAHQLHQLIRSASGREQRSRRGRPHASAQVPA